jgi:hypothetical protein
MGNARQLLELHREHTLRRLVECLETVIAGIDVPTLRAIGIDAALRDFGEACARVPYDADTGEVVIAGLGWDDPDEVTKPVGR